MGSFHKKIKEQEDARMLKILFGKKPKHRCAECHKFTLYDKKGRCVYCVGEFEKVKKKFDEWIEKEKSKARKANLEKRLNSKDLKVGEKEEIKKELVELGGSNAA